MKPVLWTLTNHWPVRFIRVYVKTQDIHLHTCGSRGSSINISISRLEGKKPDIAAVILEC